MWPVCNLLHSSQEPTPKALATELDGAISLDDTNRMQEAITDRDEPTTRREIEDCHGNLLPSIRFVAWLVD